MTVEARLSRYGAVLGFVALVLALASADPRGLALMLPVLVLAVPLILGRYVGEERIRARRSRDPLPRPRRTQRLPRPALAGLVRQTPLAGAAIGRAPPAALVPA